MKKLFSEGKRGGKEKKESTDENRKEDKEIMEN